MVSRFRGHLKRLLYERAPIMRFVDLTIITYLHYQFAACDYSSAMGAFTMRVSGDELPDGVDGFMVRGGLKVCFSPVRITLLTLTFGS